jgi:hypothetical protein
MRADPDVPHHSDIHPPVFDAHTKGTPKILKEKVKTARPFSSNRRFELVTF